jgi:hypothetical protein
MNGDYREKKKQTNMWAYVKLSMCFNKHRPENTYGGVEVQLQACIISLFHGG